MPRTTAALLLYCSSLLVVSAAPVPPPRPSKAWTDGWGKPIDPVGDCRFDIVGDKLTITVPRGEHAFDVQSGRRTAPHLLREVEGDFAVEVRVGGDYQTAAGMRRAGLLVTDGEAFLVLGWGAEAGKERHPVFDGHHSHGSTRIGWSWHRGFRLPGPAYLRIERQGSYFTRWVSLDGDWKRFKRGGERGAVLLHEGVLGRFTLTKRKVLVGVVAEATGSGGFTATFDQFKLTPLGGEAQRASR